MNSRKINWALWLGFLLSVFAFLSYPLIFVQIPTLRDFPWVNLVLFAFSVILLLMGLRRAFAPDRGKVSKVVGVLVSLLGVGILGLFLFVAFIFARHLPASRGAPQVGQKAPEFSLRDTDNKPVSLAELTSTPINNKAPKGVLLVFYRGYW